MKKILILFTTILLLFTVSCTNSYDSFDDYKLFNQDLIAVKDTTDLVGFINKQGKEIFTPQFDYILGTQFDNAGHILVSKEGSKQLINKAGDIVFDGTENFTISSYHNGYISYTLNDSNKVGIKNVKGETLFETDVFNRLMIIGDNFVVTSEAFTTHFGAIDYEGNSIIENTLSYLAPINSYTKYSNIQIYIAEDDSGYMLIDSNGHHLLDEYFDSYSMNTNATYISLEMDDLYYLYNLETKTLSDFYSYQPFMVEQNETTVSIDSEDNVSFINTDGDRLFTLNEKYRDGFIHLYRYNSNGFFYSYFETYTNAYDTDGNLVGESTEEHSLLYVTDKYALYRDLNHTYFIKNRNGEVVVESDDILHIFTGTDVYLSYEDDDMVLYSMSGKELHRTVQNNHIHYQFGLFKFYTEYDGSTYYICNTQGQKINDQLYDDDTNGYFFSRFYEDGYIVAFQDGFYGVIDFNGDIVVPFKYTAITKDFYQIYR